MGFATLANGFADISPEGFRLRDWLRFADDLSVPCPSPPVAHPSPTMFGSFLFLAHAASLPITPESCACCRLGSEPQGLDF
jgi:hypothetical protein